jgi:hypothetical protein
MGDSYRLAYEGLALQEASSSKAFEENHIDRVLFRQPGEPSYIMKMCRSRCRDSIYIVSCHWRAYD